MKSRFPLKTKIKAMIAKRKKKKKQGRNGDDYGQIPTNGATENPVGGN
tara:strand:+ start:77 stop:220 length:144 start_codon:yes stop_codon:yes gene_type:complete